MNNKEQTPKEKIKIKKEKEKNLILATDLLVPFWCCSATQATPSVISKTVPNPESLITLTAIHFAFLAIP